MKKTNIFGLVLILSTLLIGCAQPNMCADIPEVYTITCGTNVTASKTQAMAGEMITVTASRDGYRTTEIKVDGERVSETSSATFTMPTKNVNVDATFTQLYTISKTVTGGTITIPTSAAAGDIVSFSTTYDTDWYDSNCTISVSDSNGNNIDVSNNSFTMPEGNVTITVEFSIHDFSSDEKDDIDIALYVGDSNITSSLFREDFISSYENTTGKLKWFAIEEIASINNKTDLLNIKLAKSSDTNGDIYCIMNTGNIEHPDVIRIRTENLIKIVFN